jgi:hypothetical protein
MSIASLRCGRQFQIAGAIEAFAAGASETTAAIAGASSKPQADCARRHDGRAVADAAEDTYRNRAFLVPATSKFPIWSNSLFGKKNLQFGDRNFFLSPWRINNFAETDDGNCRI